MTVGTTGQSVVPIGHPAERIEGKHMDYIDTDGRELTEVEIAEIEAQDDL